MLIDQLPEAEVLDQGGRQEEPRVGHQAVVVKGRGDPVEAVGRSHPSGASLLGFDGFLSRPSSPFGRAPVLLSRIMNHAGRSVDPG
jgi:hypothetical protein